MNTKPSSGLKAVVIGGTGATGKALIQRLSENQEYTEIVALVRKKTAHLPSQVKQLVVNFDELHQYASHIEGDVAFSCLGTTLKLAGSKDAQWKVDFDYQYDFARIASRNNIPVLVLLSALNAKANSSIFYSRMKGTLENEIAELKFEKRIFVQPSLLIRPQTDRFAEKISAWLMKPFIGLGLLESIRPLPVDTVALALMNSAKALAPGTNILKVSDIVRHSKP